ncbi:MAG: IS3 family transposase [Ktedonobacteraceae bacterium]|nr:IS3 family transposase [Ktedonobacteraceae bacterium]
MPSGPSRRTTHEASTIPLTDSTTLMMLESPVLRNGHAGFGGGIRKRATLYLAGCLPYFFSSFKTECVHRQTYRSRAEAKQSIFEWIEVFYNRQRRHSSLGYVSPAVYEQQTCLW